VTIGRGYVEVFSVAIHLTTAGLYPPSRNQRSRN
jgi:hypothetical protein